MSDSFTNTEVLGVGQCNSIIQTGPQPTPVAKVTRYSHVATKFGVCKTAEDDHHAGLCHAF